MDHAPRFAIYATSTADEARELAARVAMEAEPVVVAAGGGGALDAVGGGLAGSTITLTNVTIMRHCCTRCRSPLLRLSPTWSVRSV